MYLRIHWQAVIVLNVFVSYIWPAVWKNGTHTQAMWYKIIQQRQLIHQKPSLSIQFHCAERSLLSIFVQKLNTFNTRSSSVFQIQNIFLALIGQSVEKYSRSTSVISVKVESWHGIAWRTLVFYILSKAEGKKH